MRQELDDNSCGAALSDGVSLPETSGKPLANGGHGVKERVR